MEINMPRKVNHYNFVVWAKPKSAAQPYSCPPCHSGSHSVPGRCSQFWITLSACLPLLGCFLVYLNLGSWGHKALSTLHFPFLLRLLSTVEHIRVYTYTHRALWIVNLQFTIVNWLEYISEYVLPKCIFMLLSQAFFIWCRTSDFQTWCGVSAGAGGRSMGLGSPGLWGKGAPELDPCR